MNSNLYVHLSFTSGDNFVKKTRGKSKINTLLGTRTSVPRQRDKRFIATSVCVQGKALHCRGTARGRVHCTGTGKSVKIYPLAYLYYFYFHSLLKKRYGRPLDGFWLLRQSTECGELIEDMMTDARELDSRSVGQ